MGAQQRQGAVPQDGADPWCACWLRPAASQRQGAGVLCSRGRTWHRGGRAGRQAVRGGREPGTGGHHRTSTSAGVKGLAAGGAAAGWRAQWVGALRPAWHCMALRQSAWTALLTACSSADTMHAQTTNTPTSGPTSTPTIQRVGAQLPSRQAGASRLRPLTGGLRAAKAPPLSSGWLATRSQATGQHPWQARPNRTRGAPALGEQDPLQAARTAGAGPAGREVLAPSAVRLLPQVPCAGPCRSVWCVVEWAGAGSAVR